MIDLEFAVCDDDEAALSAITGALISVFRKNGVQVRCDGYSSARSLQSAISGKRYDALFLDIDMPELDGIALGSKLRSAEVHSDIIFVSSREDRVFEALSVHPYGFVRKSSFLRDITDLAKMYITEKQSQRGGGNTIEVTSRGVIAHIKVDDIVYIESLKDYQYIYMLGAKEPEKIRLSMDGLEKQLGQYGFLRVHKGYLVNYRFIRRIDCGVVVLTTDVRIPVSRRKLQDTRQAYMRLSRNSGMMRLT